MTNTGAEVIAPVVTGPSTPLSPSSSSSSSSAPATTPSENTTTQGIIPGLLP
jgi:hypothetical protein